MSIPVEPVTGSAAGAFTRFILAFTWKRIPAGVPGPDGPRYTLSQDAGKGVPPPEDWLTPYTPPVWQHRYFLHEVQEAVYEKARWYILRDNSHANPPEAPFLLRPPALILFEAEGGSETLRHGLLVLQIEERPGDPRRLEDWLKWNETLRLFQSPYPAAGDALKTLLQLLFPHEPPATTKAATVDRWLRYLEYPVQDGEMYFALWQREENGALPHEVFPYSDSRAFVWSSLRHDDEKIAEISRLCSGDPPEFGEGCGAWVKTLNVDTPGPEKGELDTATFFEREWAGRHTYGRWVERGTFYGFTSHSGLMLCGRGNENAARNLAFFKQSLFSFICLLLYMRQCLSCMGVRLNRATRRLTGERASEQAAAQDFGKLRKDFLLFTNLYWFPQISNQQQSLEMYPLARQALGIDTLYEELRSKIEGTDAWINEREEALQTESGTRLNWIAGIGLILSLTLAVMDLTSGLGSNWGLSGALSGFIFVLLFVWVMNRQRKAFRSRHSVKPGKQSYPAS